MMKSGRKARGTKKTLSASQECAWKGTYMQLMKGSESRRRGGYLNLRMQESESVDQINLVQGEKIVGRKEGTKGLWEESQY